MGCHRLLKSAGALAVGSALIAGTSAAADRCGGSLAVDATTTLAKAARQCNVRLSDLKEANPGVDPDNVRPGQHLAMPDEIDPYTDAQANRTIAPADIAVTAAAADLRAPITDDYGLSGADGAERRAGGGRAGHRIRVRNHRASSAAPTWLQSDTRRGGYYSASERMSFQQLSALRLQNAGAPASSLRFASTPGIDARLIECTVTERNAQGETDRVRKILSTPEDTFTAIDALSGGDAFDCTLISFSDVEPSLAAGPKLQTGYRVPDYSKIGLLPPVRSERPAAEIVLSGAIVDAYRGCLLMKTETGGLWRLSSTQPAADLLGKEVTVWGESARGGACGAGPSVSVSHAVYAEPWSER